MRARFVDGPYNEAILHVTQVDHILLPVTITPTLPRPDEPPKDTVFHCQARYRLVMMNDYVATFQFEGIQAP
jgi:hypothetical protein